HAATDDDDAWRGFGCRHPRGSPGDRSFGRKLPTVRHRAEGEDEGMRGQARWNPVRGATRSGRPAVQCGGPFVPLFTLPNGGEQASLDQASTRKGTAMIPEETMRILQAAAALFTLAALGGLVMAGIRFGGHRNPPAWLAMVHGLLV